MPVQRIFPGQKITQEKLERSKHLRQEMTAAEAVLWNELRGNQLGVHFRRQQIISGFIVDFFCHSAALVIELDGEIHQQTDHQADDAHRDAELRKMGLRVARFRNEQVITDMASVLNGVRELLEA